MKKIFIILFLTSSIIFAQTESELLVELFNYSNDLTTTSSDLVSLSVDAVWFASEMAGTETTHGTITQNAQGEWNYSATPTDKLISLFANGTHLEFTFTKFDGYKQGDADDFKYSHDIDFNALIPNYINLSIQSTATPNDGKTDFLHVIKGTIVMNGETNTVNVTHSYDKYTEISGSFAIGKYNDYILGTATTPTKTFLLSDQFYTEITHNSNEGKFARGRNRWTGSSVQFAENTYQFKDVRINWYGGTEFADSANAGFYNRVIDAYQWEVMGTVLKNNSKYGDITFSTSPISGTYGPTLNATLNNSNSIVLDYLLRPNVTSVNGKILQQPINFKLNQNYPNPFNPSTMISYSIPQKEWVTLKIYNTLGQEIATLVNSEQSSGNYKVSWNATNLPSGIYFYSIKVGAYSQTKKMILQK